MCWTEIISDSDIEELMSKYSAFHDSCIVSVSYNSGNYVNKDGAMGCGDLSEHTLSMILHSQWKKPIELYFSGVRKCGITGFRDSYFCEILEATLKFQTELLGKTRNDRLIVWADSGVFNPLTYTDRYPLDNGYEANYVIAEKLKYKFL